MEGTTVVLEAGKKSLEEVKAELKSDPKVQENIHKRAHQKSKAKAKAKAEDKGKSNTKKPDTKGKTEAKKVAAKPTGKETGIITVRDLEVEFGLKAKTIRRYLRKMDESSKPRGPEQYLWDSKSKELKAIRKNLQSVIDRQKALVR